MSSEQRPPRPAANDEQSSLAALKALLLGEEQSSIQRLQEETRDPQVQTQRVAESLPDSLHKAYAVSPRELTRALETPVSECIEDSVQRNPGFFAEALYPVMGPAIRRSISQALKALVQQINQTLEHSLTIKGLTWRLEALRSGIPFAEIVLQHTLRYRVEEAFLIQTGSGLLIQHLSQGATPARDADAVSAMLTAIRDFTHDTMDRDDAESRLETVDVGDHTLWLVHGPKAYLACAIRGMPPVGLRDELADILEEIHHRQGNLLDEFDGDAASAAALVPLMEPCLQSAAAEPSRKRFPWPLVVITLIVLGLLGWWGYRQWQAHALGVDRDARLQGAVSALAAAPGIVVTDWRIRDGRLHLQGLHDPLTAAPEDMLNQAGLSAADYRLAFRRYQSSDPVAALARARQRLAPPAGVELTLEPGGILVADGTAPTPWIARAALLATTVPGVERYDDTALNDLDRRLERQLQERLQPPAQVQIRVRDGVAELTGAAPLAWIRSLPEALPVLPGLAAVHHGQLRPLERRHLLDLVETIESTTIDFVSGIDLGGEQLTEIGALAGLIHEAHQVAQDLAQPMRLEIIGRTDGTGTPEQNHFVSRRRAERVAQALSAAGPAMPEFRLRALIMPPERPESDFELRRVEFRVLGIDRTAAVPLNAR